MARERMQGLARAFGRIVKINPNYLAFLSGVFVSISINILTDLVFGNPNNELITIEWSVLFVFFVAGIMFAVLASDLEKPHQHWVLYWRDTKDHLGLTESKIIEGALVPELGNRLTYLITELLLGGTASIIGIILLLYSALK